VVLVPDNQRFFKALFASKRHQARIDGQPHHASSPALAAGAANGHDQLTERQPLLLRIGPYIISLK
jgi:hypothetical protein